MCYYADFVLLAAFSVIFQEISAPLQMLILSLVDMCNMDLRIRAKNMLVRKVACLIRLFLAVRLKARPHVF
jgi:hypothetical protein